MRWNRRVRGFSLTEVLLAIFILGIGIIGVAALFPAGIAQQRQSTDDIIGPIVAKNALAIIRGKVKPEDFGYDMVVPHPTVAGDWAWSRPAFFFANDPVTTGIDDTGGINLFRDLTIGSLGSESELIFNLSLYPGGPPNITIHAGERYYPMVSKLAVTGTTPRPQYVWDCMFRRYQGKMLVAIFVYRVGLPGGGGITYFVPPNISFPAVPPLPVSIDLTASGSHAWNGAPWDAFGTDGIAGNVDDVIITGTDPGTMYDPADAAQSWQAPGQWILDQNNNIHRVLAGRLRASDGPVQLLRPVPQMPVMPVNFMLPSVQPGVIDVVTNIFYIPTSLTVDLGSGAPTEISLTPVYAMVSEL